MGSACPRVALANEAVGDGKLLGMPADWLAMAWLVGAEVEAAVARCTIGGIWAVIIGVARVLADEDRFVAGLRCATG